MKLLTERASSAVNRVKGEWLSGVSAARFLGFSNHAAIAHLNIPHMQIQDKNGRTLYRYRLADVEIFQQQQTRGG